MTDGVLFPKCVIIHHKECHMSLEEQDQIFGRLDRETKACRSRVVALERKLVEYGNILDRTVAGLRLASGVVPALPGRQPQTHFAFDAAHWPSADDIESTLRELDYERQQLAISEKQLSSIR
jgi:hypothetical protein